PNIADGVVGDVPLPACGERVASSEAASRVRGYRQFLKLLPLTRRASRVGLSPQAGRGEEKAPCHDQLRILLLQPLDLAQAQADRVRGADVARHVAIEI